MNKVEVYPWIGALIGGFAGLFVYIIVCNYIGIFCFPPEGWNVFIVTCFGAIAGLILGIVVADEIDSEIGVILGGIIGALVGGYVGYYITPGIMASSLGIILGVVTGIVVYCIMEEYYIIYILWVNDELCPIIGGVIGGIIYWIGWKFESEFIANIIVIPIFVFIGYALGGFSNRKDIQKINDYKSEIKFWKRGGYNISGLEEVMGMEMGEEFIERKFKEYERKIQRLKQLERELSTVNTEGFESVVRSIISKIKDPKKAEEVEKEFSELKEKIKEKERKRKKVEKKYQEAKDLIKSAESVIENARDFGCNTSEAEELIENAERAINIGDYEEAIRNAEKAKELVKEIKRKSKPEISVELSKEKFQQGVWEDASLKLSNDGNAHAKDIEIGFSDEVKVKGLEIIERLDVGEETELELSFKPVDVGERVPLEIGTQFKDLDGKRYEEEETVNIKVGEIKREVVKEKEYEIPIEKKERALIIERAIYDPCKRDFVEGQLPRMKEWINRYDPGAYWFAVSIQNNTDRAIEEWGVELEFSSALKIKEAKIEGLEIEIPHEAHLGAFKISVPKEYGIVIPKGGAQRVYFKLRAEKPKTTYEISGVFKSAVGEVQIRAKEFKYLCDARSLKGAILEQPEAALEYVKTQVSYYSPAEVSTVVRGLEIVFDICRMCESRYPKRADVRSEVEKLKGYLENVADKLGESYKDFDMLVREMDAVLFEEIVPEKYADKIKRKCLVFPDDLLAKLQRQSIERGG